MCPERSARFEVTERSDISSLGPHPARNVDWHLASSSAKDTDPAVEKTDPARASITIIESCPATSLAWREPSREAIRWRKWRLLSKHEKNYA